MCYDLYRAQVLTHALLFLGLYHEIWVILSLRV